MSQIEVEFNYQGNTIIIQGNEEEKLTDIINKFFAKVEKKQEEIFFLYSGKNLNIDSTFADTANFEDKKNKRMIVLANDISDEPKNKNLENANLKRSKNIICPQCKENINFNLKDYKINFFDCNNRHKIENIILNEFEKTQLIDESKIICEICKRNDKSQTYNNQFNFCLECEKNICPLCKSSHDKSHNIINYDKNMPYVIHIQNLLIHIVKNVKKIYA